jgi:HAD superfamily hydrolase (TIGR01509 family)
MAKRRVEAVIFDMDGLMIDSEPLWHVAEQKAFAAAGVTLSEEDCLETTGLRIEEVVAHHACNHPWGDDPPQSELVEQIVSTMIGLVKSQPKPMKGLEAALQFVESLQLSVPLAVASSSHMALIEASLEGLGVRDRFAHLFSAENEAYGKPHPGVYISAATALGVDPTRCLAFEDSLNGVLAAKAARMTCIAVPEVHNQVDPRFAIADRKLSSLEELTPELWWGLVEPPPSAADTTSAL